MARIKYGRLLLIETLVDITVSCGSQRLFFFGHAARVAGVAEDALTILEDALSFARQRDPEARQPPDQRRERAIGERQLGIQEELRRLEHRDARDELVAHAL